MKAKGFSLIEVVIVIMIAGFIVIILAQLPNSLGLIGNSKHESIAKQIAAKKIEDLRSQTYDNLVNGQSVVTDSRFSELPSAGGEVQIEDCPAEICKNNEQTKKITVTINWKDAGKAKTLNVNTLISKGGLQ